VLKNDYESCNQATQQDVAERKAIHSTIKLSKVKIVTIIKTTSNIFFSFYTCCSAELNSIPSIGSGSLASTLSVKPT
jgi:hypothetical protein